MERVLDLESKDVVLNPPSSYDQVEKSPFCTLFRLVFHINFSLWEKNVNLFVCLLSPTVLSRSECVFKYSLYWVKLNIAFSLLYQYCLLCFTHRTLKQNHRPFFHLVKRKTHRLKTDLPYLFSDVSENCPTHISEKGGYLSSLHILLSSIDFQRKWVSLLDFIVLDVFALPVHSAHF